jgi:two-component system response regulator AlgR
MKLVIVDDEPLARERLRRLVAEIPDWEVAAEAGDGESALVRVREAQPDTVLLDIHMPGMDGLEVARRLVDEQVAPAVIFVTAYDEHALSAFGAAAAGYLLKPVGLQALAEALMRARRPSRAQLQALAEYAGGAASRYIHAHTRDGEIRIPVDEVLYFQAEDKYTTVYHLHGTVLIDESLRALEDELDGGFLRVHRKALVAERFIRGLVRAGAGARLTLHHTDARVPVSRRRLSEVRRLLAGYS